MYDQSQPNFGQHVGRDVPASEHTSSLAPLSGLSVLETWAVPQGREKADKEIQMYSRM